MSNVTRFPANMDCVEQSLRWWNVKVALPPENCLVIGWLDDPEAGGNWVSVETDGEGVLRFMDGELFGGEWWANPVLSGPFCTPTAFDDELKLVLEVGDGE